MTAVRVIIQLCFSCNLAGIVANKIEQSFYPVYSYSGIEPIEHALIRHVAMMNTGRETIFFKFFAFPQPQYVL